jgi:hypothetical protein
MNILHESILIGEIDFQSKLAQRGAERLKAAVETFDRVEIWSSIQSILIAAGNISKILWPKKKYEDRGEKLRDLFKVDNNNILRNRKFRNQLEHYDELVDELFNNQPTTSYIDLAMNPSMSSFGAKNCHRGYNSFNNTLVIRGQTLDLSAVLKAIEEIKFKCSPYVFSY